MLYTADMAQADGLTHGWVRLRLVLLAAFVFALTTHAKMSQYEPVHSPTRYLAKATKLDQSRSGKTEAVEPALTTLPLGEHLVPLLPPARLAKDHGSPRPGALVSPVSRPPPVPR